MKRVDSDALEAVNRAMGLTGRGAQLTEFLDGQVNQVLDVASSVRRGRTQGTQRGLFPGLLRNIHGGATVVTTSINLYAPVLGRVGLWPSNAELAAFFDIWLLYAQVQQLSGAGTFDGILAVNPLDSSQGIGIDQAGNQILGAPAQVLAHWDTIVVVAGGTVDYGIQESGEPMAKIGIRLSRTDSLQWVSTSSDIATFDCLLGLAVFPVGLDQDALV